MRSPRTSLRGPQFLQPGTNPLGKAGTAGKSWEKLGRLGKAGMAAACDSVLAPAQSDTHTPFAWGSRPVSPALSSLRSIPPGIRLRISFCFTSQSESSVRGRGLVWCVQPCIDWRFWAKIANKYHGTWQKISLSINLPTKPNGNIKKKTSSSFLLFWQVNISLNLLFWQLIRQLNMCRQRYAPSVTKTHTYF